MAAALSISNPLPHRPISARKIEANRRNAKRSTGPRTAAGKARVARNAIKHGFFAGIERWSDEDRDALDELLEGLRDEFKPTDADEDQCVATMATTSVRLAMALRYETLAARNYHIQCERELNDRIANAAPAEARHLEARRDALKAAGLWRPTLPDERTMRAILRYQGSLDRMRSRAYFTLIALQDAKSARRAAFVVPENAKTNPLRRGDGPRTTRISIPENAKTNPPQREREVRSSDMKIAKTNPPLALPT
jgi:hypothetical protein